MTFVEVLTELQTKHPKADMSPSTMRGTAAKRAVGMTFKKDRNGMYSGKNPDGTEVLVYFNDNAGVISCTEIDGDDGPDGE